MACSTAAPEQASRDSYALPFFFCLSPSSTRAMLARSIVILTLGSMRSTTVSADQRLKHFQAAVRVLPSGIPVNTVLLPMEGDAYAAAAYWKLAQDTRGSFLTPARDWP